MRLRDRHLLGQIAAAAAFLVAITLIVFAVQMILINNGERSRGVTVQTFTTP